jgi:hypothetical protein
MAEAYRDGELMLSRRELNKQLLALIPVSILPDGAIARQPFTANGTMIVTVRTG